ncbi:diaminopropionate ammonia-lyase [Bauldia sp.]|uniref:diaminopropionate ammonia-lyase n=1 Tax=Bauldia sp. TaxID=2575872 RepID=UPI003BA8C2AB
MISRFARLPARFILNPRHTTGLPYPETLKPILSEAASAVATKEIASWPGYEPTPLIWLEPLAEQLGVEALYLKDESERFGLKSFKALGGAYAVYRVLAEVVERAEGRRPTAAEIASGEYSDLTSKVTVTCATDGNHGRSVAWGAKTFGCACTIVVHQTVSDARADAIAAFGADVVRSRGNYDDSVREAAEAAAENDWIVVSDTSYPGYLDIPRDVMSGYSVMVGEALRQLAEAGKPPPTHVFVQGGVGGLAAAVTSKLWERLGAACPKIVVVEPETAACLFVSAEAGSPTVFKGDLETIMAGLSCGEVSILAWRILDPGAAGFMTVSDAAAAEAMRLMASGDAGHPVVCGESGVAGLAGLLCLADHKDWRDAIGLGEAARVLLIGSEGDTDPDAYFRIVGATSEDVARRAEG